MKLTVTAGKYSNLLTTEKLLSILNSIIVAENIRNGNVNMICARSYPLLLINPK
jgi:hypothetical protein